MGSDVKQRRKSDAHRRRTAEPSAEQYDPSIVVPSRKTFDMAAAPVDEAAENESTDAGEEFTPEEQVKLTLLINVINGWNRIAIGFGGASPVRRGAS